MREPNQRLAQARQRKEAVLPEIARLSLAGESSRETAAKVGVPKTDALRRRNSSRRECGTRAGAETRAMIEVLVDGYQTIYCKALEGLDRSQADKEIRTVTDSGDDDSDKKRSVRTETQAGNPAWLGQARGALDSIGRMMKNLGMPAQAESGEADEGAIQLEDLTDDDLAHMSVEELETLVAQCEAEIEADEDAGKEADRTPADEPAGLHDVHQAGLPGERAAQGTGEDARPGGKGSLSAADGLHAVPARQERVGEPPLPGLSPRPEPRRAADYDERGLLEQISRIRAERGLGPLNGADGGRPNPEPLRRDLGPRRPQDNP